MKITHHSKRAYLTICTENYNYLANYLGQSVNHFSNYDLHVFCLNYFPTEEQKLPGVFYHRMDYEIQNQDEASFSVAEDGNFYVNRENIRSFQIMTRKYEACLRMLEMDYEECCFIDCDSLASPFVDEIFDFLSEIESTPVFTKGPHDYMMVTVNGQVMRGDPFIGTWPIADNTKTLEWPLMQFLRMAPEERGPYVNANIFVFDSRCKKFLQKTEKFLDALWRVTDVYWYAPFQDETIVNVLLWKEKAKIFPSLYINISGFETIQHFIYTEVDHDQVFNLRGEEFAFYKLPADKRLVKAFHGEKRPEEIEKILNFLFNKIKFSNEHVK